VCSYACGAAAAASALAIDLNLVRAGVAAIIDFCEKEDCEK
jgi:hypothetical protein